jgi:two-component system LytT family response regulator
MKVLLLDDDRSNSEILSKILEMYCPKVQVTGIAEDITQAMLLIKENEPDLIFLDINLKNESGFDILPLISSLATGVIFITAHDQYILQALRSNAIDYLLKPIDVKEVIKAVERALKKIPAKQGIEKLTLLHEPLNKPAYDRKIIIPTSRGYEFILTSSIIRLEANGAYTNIFITDNRKILVTRNIKEYELILPEITFVRIHHSHIINLDYVKYYHKGRGGYVEMTNGETIQVATRRKDTFLAKFER